VGATESHDLPEDTLLHGIGHDPAARSDPVAVGGEAGHPATLGTEAGERVKTGTSREVDLTPRLVAALQDRRTALELEALVAGADGVSSPWVFARPGGHGATPGSPQRPYAASRLFDRLIVAADLPRFVLYDLRHSYASHLIAQRADPGYVARQMGHSSVATTLSFYAHWFPKDDRRIVEQHEQVRAAAVPRPLPAEDASLPLDSDNAMAPLWHHSQESDPELLDSAEAVGSVAK